jgi:hypothetical protein
VITILLVILDLTSLVAAAGLGYYSVNMIFMMRWGRFEKSWKWLAVGAFSLWIGYSFLTLEDFLPAYSLDYTFVDYAGTIFATMGIIFFLVGLRQTYRVWRLEDLKTRKNKKFAVSP